MEPTRSAPRSRRPFVVAACAVAAVCLCLAGAVAAYFLFRDRFAQSNEPTVEYVLDASPRMQTSSGGDPRITVARGVLAEIVRASDPRLTAGLRLFGSEAVLESCQDTDLIVPFAEANQEAIAGRLDGVDAGALTDSPMAQAMIAAIRDMSSTRGPHSIVVVTGGADSCNPEAAELIRREAERAGIELRLFVVGFDVPPDEVQAVRALVEIIPGATYQDAPEAASLRRVLTEIQVQVDRLAEPEPEPGPVTAGQTACDHPYLPLRSGASWTYSGTDGTFTWSVNSASGSSATIGIAFPGGEMTLNWECGPAGIVSYDFGNITSFDMGGVVTMDILESSGVFLPPAGQLTPGNSWPLSYTQVMNFSLGADLDMTTTISETWTVAGFETVSTPAGTFRALRLDGSTTTTTTAFMVEVPTVTTSSSYWLAEGVGFVRYQYSGEGYSGSADLVSYSVP